MNEHKQIQKKARMSGPFSFRFINSTVMAMLAVMPAVTARGELHRLEVETDNAAGHVDAGLALNAQGLKREGILRAADQQVTAAADAERNVTAHAAVVAGKVAATDALGRCMHRPRQGWCSR